MGRPVTDVAVKAVPTLSSTVEEKIEVSMTPPSHPSAKKILLTSIKFGQQHPIQSPPFRLSTEILQTLIKPSQLIYSFVSN